MKRATQQAASKARGPRPGDLLRAERGPGLRRALLPSAGLHSLLVAAWVLPSLLGLGIPGCSERRSPLLDKDVFMVEAVVLPKAKSMPKKAAAPRPAPAGESGKKKAPEPVIQDQMVLKKKQEKTEGVERKSEKKPEEKPKKKSRSELLAARTEEVSDEPIFETSVDGAEDVEPDIALSTKFGKPMSPYERLVHDKVKDNWFPKFQQQTADPSRWAVVSFDIDDAGVIASPGIERRSGDRIFDASCTRAVARTRRVPAPPEDAPRRFHIRFSPEDKK